MDVLKRIKASTLMETMVATVLIVVIFMISSLILNNLFIVQAQKNHSALDNHLQKLEYLYGNGKVGTPYNEHWRDWEINILPPGQGEKVLIKAIKDGQTSEEMVEHIFYATIEQKK